MAALKTGTALAEPKVAIAVPVVPHGYSMCKLQAQVAAGDHVLFTFVVVFLGRDVYQHLRGGQPRALWRSWTTRKCHSQNSVPDPPSPRPALTSGLLATPCPPCRRPPCSWLAEGL